MVTPKPLFFPLEHPLCLLGLGHSPPSHSPSLEGEPADGPSLRPPPLTWHLTANTASGPQKLHAHLRANLILQYRTPTWDMGRRLSNDNPLASFSHLTPSSPGLQEVWVAIEG